MAARRPDIHRALHTKVSRERVGKELEGMLSGRGAQPGTAITLVAELTLAGSVFVLPVPGLHCQRIFGPLMEQEYDATPEHPDEPHERHLRELAWQEGLALLRVLHSSSLLTSSNASSYSTRSDSSNSEATGTDPRLLPLAVFVAPFRHLQCCEIVKNGNAKQFSVIHYMFKEGVKFKLKDCHSMTTLMQVLDRMMDLLQQAATQFESITRLQVGLLLRETKDMWMTALQLAGVLLWRQSDLRTPSSSASGTVPTAVDWIAVSQQLGQRIVRDWHLDHCWTVRPLLDGRAVIDALQLPRGPQVGVYLEEQTRWMLAHPDGTVDDCRAHLRQVKRKGEHARSASPPVSAPPTEGSDCVQAKHIAKKMHVKSMDTT